MEKCFTFCEPLVGRRDYVLTFSRGDGPGLDFISFPLGHVGQHQLALITGSIMEVLSR